MDPKHALAVGRSFVTALTLGLAALIAEQFVSGGWHFVILVVLLVIDLMILVYLWLATLPEPEVKQPSATQARIEARRKRQSDSGAY